MKVILAIQLATLALIITLRLFGGEIVATAVFTLVIFTATAIAALNMAYARRKTNGRY